MTEIFKVFHPFASKSIRDMTESVIIPDDTEAEIAKTSTPPKSKALETEDELEARKTWHHHRFVENARKISTVRSKSEERSQKIEKPEIRKPQPIVEEKVGREGRNRSRNGSNFRRRCRSNDVILSQKAAEKGSMSSLEMELVQPGSKVHVKPYSDLDINSVAGTSVYGRRNYSDVYRKVC